LHAIVVLFLASYPGWYVGGFKLGCIKDMWEQQKDAWKKRQVSYDPKDKAILDPIFAEAAATDNPIETQVRTSTDQIIFKLW
jgi:hypothetical protein